MARTIGKVVRHDRKEIFKIADYIKENYKKSNLNNADFAKKATEDLGLELNRDHIRNMLTDLEIEPNHSRFVETEGGLTAMARLARVEEDLRNLELRFNRFVQSST
jgi:hypothetical protein